jgi:hypothetical protein
LDDLTADLNALAASAPVAIGRMCRVGAALSQMTPEQETALIALIDNSRVGSGKIAEVLAKHGLEVGYSSVERHKRRLKPGMTGCKCPP